MASAASPKSSGFSFSLVLLLAFLGLATAWVYWPGLNGPFVLDDLRNIHALPVLHITELSFQSLYDAFFSVGKSYPHRGIPRVSFGLNFYFAGGKFDTTAFKITNVVIHLLVAGTLFLLARTLLARVYRVSSSKGSTGDSSWATWTAFAITAFWVLHPIQLTAVLYVVQRMTSLSTLFVLLGLNLQIPDLAATNGLAGAHEFMSLQIRQTLSEYALNGNSSSDLQKKYYWLQ